MHALHPTLSLLALAAAACSTADTDSPRHSRTRAGSDTAQSTADTGGDADTATCDGAASERAMEPESRSGDPNHPTSCADVCAADGFECGAECDGSAGTTVYFDGFSYETMHLATCGEPVSEQWEDYWGDSYDLIDFECCCLVPAVTELSGDPEAPQSCEDICAAACMECQPSHEWSLDDTGGSQRYYRDRSDRTRSRIEMGGCSDVPEQTFIDDGDDWVLSSFSCACI